MENYREICGKIQRNYLYKILEKITVEKFIGNFRETLRKFHLSLWKILEKTLENFLKNLHKLIMENLV